MAAEQDDVDAQFNLGLLYEQGKGVPQDEREAVKWYKEAAERGHALAQLNLGIEYSMSQEYVLAHLWFTLAAARSLNSENRKYAAAARDATAAKLTPQQLAMVQILLDRPD
jgi:TPR repeat protein